MEPYFKVILEDIADQALPVALSFVDDALILVLSNFGLTLPGLQWLSPALLACTIAYWGFRLWRKSSLNAPKEA